MKKKTKKEPTELAPTFANVIVAREGAAEKSEGGIILPGDVQEKKQRGTVVAAGPDAKQVKVDDLIIFKAGVGVEIQAVGSSFVVLEEKDILLVLR